MTGKDQATHRGPDPHALKIAESAQASVESDLVILFGSRAVGDHREASDVDILVVTGHKRHVSSQVTAEKAARSYMRENPPELELGIIAMDRKTFGQSLWPSYRLRRVDTPGRTAPEARYRRNGTPLVCWIRTNLSV